MVNMTDVPSIPVMPPLPSITCRSSDKGTTDWQKYDVVLDVAQDATGIFFGVLLSPSGTLWLNSAKFEVVGPTVLTTDGDRVQRPEEATNLDFEQ
jgi:hypothetical protein